MNSDPAINTDALTADDAAWLCGLLQAGDSFYPTGSYAHSFGLEGLVQLSVVRDRSTLREFIFESVLPALQHAELPLALHAWRAFGATDWQTIGELSVLSSALRSSREARLAAENIGRQRAEQIVALRPTALGREFLARATTEAWPFSSSISAALEGRVLQSSRIAVSSGLTYATVSSIISAAMKLLRLGQNASQSLLTEALQEAPRIITAAQSVSFEEIGWFNPWLDIAAARHETADSRMFIS